jgi:8-oxo-dGTP diphosphatase
VGAASVSALVETLYLVRHAKAGDREAWTEDDRLRPLTKKGRRQAEGLVHLFGELEVAGVVSSSSLRCAQTVRPLALARAVGIQFSDDLVEGAPTAATLGLIAASSAGTVLCSHAEVITAAMIELEAHGTRIHGRRGWKKGSIWVLERSSGRILRARYVPPPEFG